MKFLTWLEKQDELIDIYKLRDFIKDKPELKHIYQETEDAIDMVPSIKWVPKKALEVLFEKEATC